MDTAVYTEQEEDRGGQQSILQRQEAAGRASGGRALWGASRGYLKKIKQNIVK